VKLCGPQCTLCRNFYTEYTEISQSYTELHRGFPSQSGREIPALEGGYRAFYNPGGPGPESFEGVRYTAPGPPDMEPVIIALDDPMRVDRAAP